MLGMEPFESDVSTAFLREKISKLMARVRYGCACQGMLSRSLELSESGQLMKLIKPIMVCVTPPRACYEEATERILRTGKGTIIQHPLDACLFLAYDQDHIKLMPWNRT